MDSAAQDYVKLVLAVGIHDADYVDAYYGPPEWKKEADSRKLPLDEIAKQAADVRGRVTSVPQPSGEMERLRQVYLDRQLSSLLARVRMLQGERLSFDEESKALYDAVAPRHDEAHFQAMLDKLEPRFPGSGSLVDRYDAWRRAFVIPREKLDTVFQAAIAACR
jgi:hypothetical protein